MTLCVASHWLLDLVTHRPDLLLVPWGERFYGLGLWNSRAGTLVVELAMFGVAVSSTPARRRPVIGRAESASGRWWASSALSTG